MTRWRRYWIGLAPAVALAVIGCAQEEYPAALWEAQHPAALTASPVDASVPDPGTCRQAAAQPLPQRLVAVSAQATSGADLELVSDLFTRFQSICGACHGPQADPPGFGGFRLATADDFSSYPWVADNVLAHVESDGPDPNNPDGPTSPMPPFGSGGRPFSERTPVDPVYQFDALVRAWIAAGQPSTFPKPTSGGDAGAADAGPSATFTMPVSVGLAMTNIGNCIPDAPMVALGDMQKAARDLDAMFQGLTKTRDPNAAAKDQLGLPEHLSQTDLVSFDSAILAQNRVVAFQPAYPLWSDDAGKLRHVRVPLGQSIQFEKATQEFTIPENTRFYKTFMKKIVDTDGSIRWRKIETRLIVARHEPVNLKASQDDVNSLFGSYQWNDSETEATLVETPLTNSEPFADTLFLYNTDEQLAAEVLKQNPANVDLALLTNGAARHYAIPSSTRCVECHMGSPSQSFILGFRPVQLNRRPTGRGWHAARARTGAGKPRRALAAAAPDRLRRHHGARQPGGRAPPREA